MDDLADSALATGDHDDDDDGEEAGKRKAFVVAGALAVNSLFMEPVDCSWTIAAPHAVCRHKSVTINKLVDIWKERGRDVN